MNDSGEIIINVGYVVACKIALVVGPTVEPSVVGFVAKLCPSQVHRDLRDADSLSRWRHARVHRVFLDLGLQGLVEMRVLENMDGTLEPRSDRWSGSSNPFRIAESATRQCWLIFTNFSSIDILNKNLKKTSKTIVWFIFSGFTLSRRIKYTSEWLMSALNEGVDPDLDATLLALLTKTWKIKLQWIRNCQHLGGLSSNYRNSFSSHFYLLTTSPQSCTNIFIFTCWYDWCFFGADSFRTSVNISCDSRQNASVC